MTMKTLTMVALAAAWIVPPALGQSPTSKPARLLGYVNIPRRGLVPTKNCSRCVDLTAEQKNKLLDIEAERTKAMNDSQNGHQVPAGRR